MSASKSNKKNVKKELAEKLRAAAELEHQFTCMYLYAAFSLKKHPDGVSFGEADVELTRRWASVVYMIARQEMEHLAIVNQLLAAIGEPPYFHRRNIPYHPDFFRAPSAPLYKAPGIAKKRDYFSERTAELRKYLEPFLPHGISPKVEEYLEQYVEGDLEVAGDVDDVIQHQNKLTPGDIPFLFTPFDLLAARRYTVMESPFVAHLILSGQIEIAADLIKWAYKADGGDYDCILARKWQNPPGGPDDNIEPGDIERYYEEIKKLVSQLGDQGFVPVAEGRQVEILSQYDIYLFPITDEASAKNGIELIVKQGEAVGSSPGFDSHFRHFYDIAEAYEQKLGLGAHKLPIPERILSNCEEKVDYTHFKPFLDVLNNPQRSDIKYPYVLKVFDLFNFGYKTMCFCLNGLYGWYSERKDYPFLSQALRDIIFAPTMTMFIRAIGEVLVLLPSGTEKGGKWLRAAPNFDMEDANNVLEKKYANKRGAFRSLEINPDANGGDWQHASEYQFYLDIDFYTQRFDHVIATLKELHENKKWLNELYDLPFEGDAEEQVKHIKKSLEYAYQNMSRMTANLKKNYQDNVYKNFNVF